jgi:hypothetical protein
MNKDREQNKIDVFNIKTKLIAKELDLNSDTILYRWLHPVMVVGIDRHGNLLLRGNKQNGVLVVDEYEDKPNRTRASALDDPGLNFTREYLETYKGKNRRISVAFSWSDQDSSLKIYDDAGSEARSIYCTLAENKFFKVKAKDIDTHQVALSLILHQKMEQIDLIEEPIFYDFLNEQDKKGVRTIVYLPTEDGEKVSEVTFEEIEDGVYVADVSKINDERINTLEYIALLRVCMELKNFESITLSNGTVYSFEDLKNMIKQSGEYQTVSNIEKSED